MPRRYDSEFCRRVVELVRSGRTVATVAADLGLAEATVYRWKAQDLIDRGERPGHSSAERGELAAANQPIRELETELELVRQAAALFDEGVRPKDKYPVIAELAGQGSSAKLCCRLLRVAPSGFFIWRRRAPSPREIRTAWLTDLVLAVHADSRGTYRWRRVHAELTYGHGIVVNRKTIRKIMRAHALHGLPGMRKLFTSRANLATAADLIERDFDRPAPNQLWVTDITEHPTREGKVYCCVILDVFPVVSRWRVSCAASNRRLFSITRMNWRILISWKPSPPAQTTHGRDVQPDAAKPPGKPPSKPHSRTDDAGGWRGPPSCGSLTDARVDGPSRRLRRQRSHGIILQPAAKELACPLRTLIADERMLRRFTPER